MILLTHAIIGGSVGAVAAKTPIVAFSLGFLGHFLADAIPHWHYPTHNLHAEFKNRDQKLAHLFAPDNLRELVLIAAECLLGFAVVLFTGKMFARDLQNIFWGAVGGVFPDFLQFVYFKIASLPLAELQAFHKRVHAKIVLDSRPWLGISSQLLICALFLLAMR